jgi:hypothetical protein
MRQVATKSIPMHLPLEALPSASKLLLVYVREGSRVETV